METKWYELSGEEEQKRDEFLFEVHAERSKLRGDWNFRQADMISGLGDYIPGYDDGEGPRGAR